MPTWSYLAIYIGTKTSSLLVLSASWRRLMMWASLGFTSPCGGEIQQVCPCWSSRMIWSEESGDSGRLSLLCRRRFAPLSAASCLRESVAKSKQAQGQDAKIENRDTKIVIQDKKIDAQNARITDLETEFGTTQIELWHLKTASDTYLAIRNRWISNFIKSKHRDRLSPGDDGLIKSGDTAAHHGDPYIDALLYETSSRIDYTMYKALYGFRYKEVLENCKFIDWVFSPDG